MGFTPSRKMHEYCSMSAMDEDKRLPCNEKNFKRRSRLSSLLCFCRQLPLGPESPTSTAPLIPDEETSDPKPLYYILSEVGSEFMDSPDQPMGNSVGSDSNYQPNRFPRFRFRFPNCCKGMSDKEKDGETTSLEREITTPANNEGDNNIRGRAVNCFGISTKSALSPLDLGRSTSTRQSLYPSQARRYQTDQISLYPSTIRSKYSEDDGSDREDCNKTLLNVSVDCECAQLVVRSDGSNQIEDGSLLGVALPHPAVHSSSENDYRLGVQTGHPYWIEREKENIWQHVDSDPFDGESLTAPPSPMVVETSTADDNWDSTSQSLCFSDDNITPQDETLEAEDLRLPAIWNHNVYRPICTIARELSACGHVDDACSLDEAPFDEVAIDMEQNPFDEVAIDMGRRMVDSHMMMISQLSDSASISQQYFDDESWSGARWPGYCKYSGSALHAR